MRSHVNTVVLAMALVAVLPLSAAAQSVDIKGYGMVGATTFTASETFDAVLGSSSGTIFGGGAEVGLPLGGLYVGVGGWRFKQDGERVFVSGGEVFPLGIPVEVTITPLEIIGGWRFRGLSARVVPYVGGGYSSWRYKETSTFADGDENVDDRFAGFHLLGGAEMRLARWLGVAGEVAWTSIPDAIGEGGAAAAFDETNLGGTSFRLKVTIGR